MSFKRGLSESGAFCGLTGPDGGGKGAIYLSFLQFAKAHASVITRTISLRFIYLVENWDEFKEYKGQI